MPKYIPWLVIACLGFACGSEETKNESDERAAICLPGETQPCLGNRQCEGAQSCLPDGNGWGTCDCGSSGSGGSVGSGGTVTSGGTAGVSGTTGGSSTGGARTTGGTAGTAGTPTTGLSCTPGDVCLCTYLGGTHNDAPCPGGSDRRCCADPGYPSDDAGFCECRPNFCYVDDSVGICRCGRNETGVEKLTTCDASYSPCCLNTVVGWCTCGFTCQGSEVPVASCSTENVGCQDSSLVKVSSCGDTAPTGGTGGTGPTAACLSNGPLWAPDNPVDGARCGTCMANECCPELTACDGPCASCALDNRSCPSNPTWLDANSCLVANCSTECAARACNPSTCTGCDFAGDITCCSSCVGDTCEYQCN